MHVKMSKVRKQLKTTRLDQLEVFRHRSKVLARSILKFLNVAQNYCTARAPLKLLTITLSCFKSLPLSLAHPLALALFSSLLHVCLYNTHVQSGIAMVSLVLTILFALGTM